MDKLTIDLRNKVISKNISWDIEITQMDEMFIRCDVFPSPLLDPSRDQRS
jgi:hypothetical protein